MKFIVRTKLVLLLSLFIELSYLDPQKDIEMCKNTIKTIEDNFDSK